MADHPVTLEAERDRKRLGAVRERGGIPKAPSDWISFLVTCGIRSFSWFGNKSKGKCIYSTVIPGIPRTPICTDTLYALIYHYFHFSFIKTRKDEAFPVDF